MKKMLVKFIIALVVGIIVFVILGNVLAIPQYLVKIPGQPVTEVTQRLYYDHFHADEKFCEIHYSFNYSLALTYGLITFSAIILLLIAGELFMKSSHKSSKDEDKTQEYDGNNHSKLPPEISNEDSVLPQGKGEYIDMPGIYGDVRSSYIFSKDQSSDLISISELRCSRPVLDKYGQHYPNRPEPLWLFLDKIYAMLNEKGVLYHQENVYVQTSEARKAFFNEEMGVEFGQDTEMPVPFYNWQFNSLYTRVIIPDHHNDYSGVLSVAYNEQGIQASIGLIENDTNLVFNLGGLNYFISTGQLPGAEVITYADLIIKVASWVVDFKEVYVVMNERLKKLKEKSLWSGYEEIIFNQFQEFLASTGLDNSHIYQEFEKLKSYIWATGSKKYDNGLIFYSIGMTPLNPRNDIHLVSIIPLGSIFGKLVQEV